jgi:hypothetical protein
MLYRIASYGIVLIGLFVADNAAAVAMLPASNPRNRDIFLKMPLKDQKAAPIQIADAGARPDGVRLTTTWPTPTINQGETIVNTLDVYNAVAGQKIRIQNSNHGATYFTANFDAAIQAAIAAVPGVTYAPVNAQQMEITLAAGTYKIPITQTVTKQAIPGNVDDAPWAPGTQLQTDWLLSSAPSNGAPVETGFTVDSKWITYAQQGGSPAAAQKGIPEAPRQSASSDARWSLLRSIPNIGTAGTVTFEIGETNYALTSPTTLQITIDGASTAGDADFTRGLNASITAALKPNVSYDAQTGTLTFDPKTVFPFIFTMTAAAVNNNKDYVLSIGKNQIGQIDVATPMTNNRMAPQAFTRPSRSPL